MARFAEVCVDVPTRDLEGTFSYAVPESLESGQTGDDVGGGCGLVGTTVLVTFHGRPAVGYVMATSEAPADGLDPERVSPIELVLAPPAFGEAGARVATWMAREYACPLPSAVRPFLAPGQKARVRRSGETGAYELVCDRTGTVDDRWVSLTSEGRSYEPPARASRQRAVLAALADGPLRMAELVATAGAVSGAVRTLEGRGLLTVVRRRRYRGSDATTLSSAKAARPERLTTGQRDALASIEAARHGTGGGVVVLDGVTGSGKTEVYLDAIEACLDEGRGAIVLVPEISLTPQTVGRFRSRFGDGVAVMHSRLSAGERRDQWDLIRQGVAQVVVGARSALFAPVERLGLIVIDEEHEHSYKQEQAPRYHAREVAVRMAREHGAGVVLGSATPSVESLRRAELGSWDGVPWVRVAMPERPGGATLPRVEVVDMTRQFALGNRSIFSRPLRTALEGVVERSEKAVTLINRRGFASFVMCRECGCVPECPHCSTSLTYHERTHALVCHTCGSTWPQATFPNPMTRCPNCGSRYMGAYGVGTQRVEDELRMLLADMGAVGESVEVVRMDADTTATKGGHQRLLERFDAAPCAVLVGTQMIAKGLDFPEVTLVGVLNADTTLKLPDFRAAERTYDLLEQVAGRAGRGGTAGTVVIQSYWASHPAIEAVRRHDRQVFLGPDLDDRRDAGYPPFGRLANVIVWGRRPDAVRSFATRVAGEIRRLVGDAEGWQVLGPAECVRAKVKDRFRRHVLVKAPAASSPGEVLSAAVSAADKPRDVSVAIDVDAYDLM